LIGLKNRATNITDTISGELKKLGATEIIAACPSCKSLLSKNIPDLNVLSLYKVLNEIGVPKNQSFIPQIVSIHDPCGSRTDYDVQESVRNLIINQGHTIEELEKNREKTLCCGLGGMAGAIDPELNIKAAARTINNSKHDLVTYCSSCRENFAGYGARVVHVLDLLFNSSGNNAFAKPTNPSELCVSNLKKVKSNLTSIKI